MRAVSSSFDACPLAMPARILVVDDQRANVEMMAGVLKARGYAVSTAHGGEHLRGFTAFTDRADPDEVMELLRAYHATLGRTVDDYGGTLEHFAGDGIMIFFSDPLPVDKPAELAVRMAIALQEAFLPISKAWAK